MVHLLVLGGKKLTVALPGVSIHSSSWTVNGTEQRMWRRKAEKRMAMKTTRATTPAKT